MLGSWRQRASFHSGSPTRTRSHCRSLSTLNRQGSCLCAQKEAGTVGAKQPVSITAIYKGALHGESYQHRVTSAESNDEHPGWQGESSVKYVMKFLTGTSCQGKTAKADMKSSRRQSADPRSRPKWAQGTNMRSPSYISKASRWGLSQHRAFSTPASGHLGQLEEGSGHAFIISVPCLPFQLQVWKCFVSRCLVIFNDSVFNFCFEPWSFSLAFPTVILSSIFDRCLWEITAWGNRGSEVQMQPGRQSLGSCPLSSSVPVRWEGLLPPDKLLDGITGELL